MCYAHSQHDVYQKDTRNKVMKTHMNKEYGDIQEQKEPQVVMGSRLGFLVGSANYYGYGQ